MRKDMHKRPAPTLRKSKKYAEMLHRRLDTEIRFLFAFTVIVIVALAIAAVSGIDMIGDIAVGTVFIIWFPLLIASAMCARKCDRCE